MPAKRTAAYPRRLALPSILLVVMLLTAAATWFAATWFQSPKQVEARAQPPAAEPITAIARKGILEDTFTSRVTFVPGDATKVPLTALSGRIVTGTPLATGHTITAGDQVLEVNGRPLFALTGDFPLYRDLAKGDTGPDVALWQDFLRSLGFSIPASENSRFGPVTLAKTHAFYKNRHYTAPDLAREPALEPARPSSTDPPAPDDAGESEGVATMPAVPMSEFVRIPAESTVLQSRPGVGESMNEDTALTLTDGSHHAVTAIPVTRAPDISGSEKVRITTDTGEVIEAQLDGAMKPRGDEAKEDATEQAPGEAESSTVPYRVKLPSGVDSFEGKDFLIEIIVDALDDASVIVPARSIVHGVSGDAVFVKNSTGEYTEVSVSILGEMRGEVAVMPKNDGALQDGDRVRVQ